ncbi:MAG: RapZ C-terminal domain-containing protein [Chitinophagales bacterium]
MNNNIDQQLSQLFEEWAGEKPSMILPLAPSGSPRRYFRLKSENKTAIGTYGLESKENHAFVVFSKHFKAKGLPVPEIYAEDANQNIYLQEDLGGTALYQLLPQKGESFSEDLLQLYKKSVAKLAKLQVKGGKDLDYSVCYPRAAFDKQSILWDFNYFKYYFLRMGGFPFDEQALENDAHRFADYLLEADHDYFMFRDFQSRNIMIRGGEPFFIDYQGGRKGALQYDLASLLYQAKANISQDTRKELLNHYLDTLETMVEVDRAKFEKYYYAYVLIRSMQVLGAYGFRGLIERKEHFLKSIPFALQNIRWILQNVDFPVEMPELLQSLSQLTDSNTFTPFDHSKGTESPLTVYIHSFSYKKGLPIDESGNGGGFIFDCRFLHNPGRYAPYKKLTGRDKSVITFLQQRSNIAAFLNNVFQIVDEAVENYIERGFASLQVNFGCTGGQHRSVYSADQLTQHLQEKYGIKVQLEHIEQERKNWIN